jgi:microcystin-dependent protein
MSEPFLGEIRMMGFNFAPRGWAMCDGQILPINSNQSLYSLLGTTYGGDGRTSFALPDLRSRTPLHRSDQFDLGEKGGGETVTLTNAQLAAHSHAAKGTTAIGDVNKGAPTRSFATPGDLGDPIYHNASNLVAMGSGMISNTGGGQAHNNMQPTLTITFCIALQGLFPSRS